MPRCLYSLLSRPSSLPLLKLPLRRCRLILSSPPRAAAAPLPSIAQPLRCCLGPCLVVALPPPLVPLHRACASARFFDAAPPLLRSFLRSCTAAGRDFAAPSPPLRRYLCSYPAAARAFAAAPPPFRRCLLSCLSVALPPPLVARSRSGASTRGTAAATPLPPLVSRRRAAASAFAWPLSRCPLMLPHSCAAAVACASARCRR